MLLRALAIGMALAFSAQAQDGKEAKKPTPQRITACNNEAAAKKLRGDERQSFINACLKATPQERMATCNNQAAGKQLKGEPRKKFMSECLKA